MEGKWPPMGKIETIEDILRRHLEPVRSLMEAAAFEKMVKDANLAVCIAVTSLLSVDVRQQLFDVARQEQWHKENP